MLKKIEYTVTEPNKAEITANDIPIHGVTDFEFRKEVGSLPEAILHLTPLSAHITELADMKLALDSNSPKEAAKCLKLYAQLDDEFYNNVRSMLHGILCELTEKEMNGHLNDYDKAEFIIKRVLEEI